MPTWLRQLVLPGLALGALLGLMFGSKLVPQHTDEDDQIDISIPKFVSNPGTPGLHPVGPGK